MWGGIWISEVFKGMSKQVKQTTLARICQTTLLLVILRLSSNSSSLPSLPGSFLSMGFKLIIILKISTGKNKVQSGRIIRKMYYDYL